MRIIRAILPIMSVGLLAGCNDTVAPPAESEETPIQFQSGQWELTRKTTGYTTPTLTAAEHQAALGQVKEQKVCVHVGDDGVLPADVLAGAEGKDCNYTDKLYRRGRLIATLACKSGTGTSQLSVEGNYTNETLTVGVSTSKTQNGAVTLRTTHDLWAKRVGDCPST